MRRRSTCVVFAALALAGCAGTRPTAPPADVRTETGVASYYGDQFQGRPMASGKRYDKTELVAAHRTLPFGTRVRVTNLANDRVVVLTVLDRGPFIKGRVIDVSRRAANDLDFVRQGTTRVRVETVD